MIRKKTLSEQQEFWVPRDRIKGGRGSEFYDRLAVDLDKEGFGAFVREQCAPYYSVGGLGRPPVDPEVYFKMPMVVLRPWAKEIKILGVSMASQYGGIPGEGIQGVLIESSHVGACTTS